MEFSRFTRRFSSQSGIVQLMEDLGSALSGNRKVVMLGGGNPSHIPEVQQFLHERLERILEDPAEFAHLIGDYDEPQGERKFIESLAQLLQSEYGWDIGPQNIVLTAGSQAGFIYLFNMFAGEFDDGTYKQIMLPLIPEYIGYSDVGLSDNLFVSCRPEIEIIGDHLFKYHVNFQELDIGENIGALCVSRPTNPTGNVLTDDEMNHLLDIAGKRKIPLIIDNAYGLPFPDIIFTEANAVWNENTILCMSLSKFGLPGARTGIIVAPEEVVKTITNMNAILTLALGSLGPTLVLDLVKSGEITRISRNIIRPYYQEKANHAVSLIEREFRGLDYFIHKPEGAIFLWLWFPGLSITSEELYQRLKKRGVLVISGHHFFPGFSEEWTHRHECIRMTYSMPPQVVEEGIKIIAEEIRKLS